MKAGARASSARAAAAALLAGLGLLVSCASGPPPPDWQANARAALDQAVAAHLAGDSRAEALAFERGRREVARTGRADLLARAELMRCAARTASLVFEPCTGFETLREDAAAPEKAYAAYLAAQALPREEIARLPPAQQATAALLAGGTASPATLQAIEDPLARLIAAAVLFQAGRASPAMVTLAADTASAQGWRRPLLAWLNVQAAQAQRGGDRAEEQRLRRRMEQVLAPR